MDIKITKEGELFFARAGKWKAQYCPFGNYRDTKCGDWCPLFNIDPLASNEFIISLCKRVYTVEEFVDERGD